jgi:hypothetical protein
LKNAGFSTDRNWRQCFSSRLRISTVRGRLVHLRDEFGDAMYSMGNDRCQSTVCSVSVRCEWFFVWRVANAAQFTTVTAFYTRERFDYIAYQDTDYNSFVSRLQNRRLRCEQTGRYMRSCLWIYIQDLFITFHAGTPDQGDLSCELLKVQVISLTMCPALKASIFVWGPRSSCRRHVLLSCSLYGSLAFPRCELTSSRNRSIHPWVIRTEWCFRA